MNSGALIHCGNLATMAGGVRFGTAMADLRIVQDGAVIWRDGKIVAVGTTDELRHQLPDSAEDVQGALVTPGLIDAHTHLLFGGNRASEFEAKCQGASYQQIAAEGGGIQSSVRSTRNATDDELVRSANRRLRWMLSSGTTALEAKSGYGLDLHHEVRCLRLLGSCGPQQIKRTALVLHAVAPEYRGDRGRAVECACNEVIPEVAQHGLADFADIFVEAGYFSDSDARAYSESCKANGLRLRMHVDQFGDSGGAVLAAELGALTADHLEHTSEEGIHALKDAGVFPVLLPASVQCIRSSKYPDSRRMIEIGLPVVLATDFNPGSSPCCSLPYIMSLACLHMGLSSSECLSAVTINAAAALDWSQCKGSIEVGKDADLVVWDAKAVDEIPYWIGAPLVKRVVLEGRVVLG